MMDPDRFRRAKQIILALRDVPPADRSRFVADACGPDRQLLDEVQSLLGQETGGFVRTEGLTPVLESVLKENAVLSGSRHPERVGPYRILEVLGRGGMGVVYRAVQEAPIHREVALKSVRGSLLSGRALARFETERQILAMMEHPHIARVFDAGEDDDGDPYFVMELVRGTAITEYCRQEHIGPGGRLELVSLVCAAVHHAHQRGIIHRDLKPSNVLVSTVDGVAVPKIIDFGIAKGLASSIGPAASMTLEGQVLGTLEYMSPEQALGSATDTRADIYALGVILFEVLTGALPHAVSGKPPPEVARIITETPARRLRDAAPDRAWDADLEIILRKALATEPDQRYGSAADLGGDIERYLQHRPVLARPPSTMYQIRKLVSRHRTPFVLAAALAVSLLVFSVTMSVLFTNQSRARARAQLETEKTRETNVFLRNMFGSVSLDKEGWRVTVVEVLEKAAADVEALRGRPEIYVDLCDIIGNAYLSLEQYTRAEEVFHKALAVQEMESHGPQMANLYIDMTAVLFHQNAFDEAESYAKQALDLCVLHHGELSEETGTALNSLAMVKASQRRLDEAEPLYRRALAVQEALHGRVNSTFAMILNNLCHVLLERGDFKEAETLFEESLALRLQLWDNDHPWVAGTRRNLAAVKMALGDYDAAEALCRDALRVHLAGDGTRSKAADFSTLARILDDLGRRDEAEAALRRALAMYRELYGPDHNLVAGELLHLAMMLHEKGEDAGADSTFREAVAIQERVMPPGHPDTGAMLTWYGMFQIDQNRLAEAERNLRRGLAIQEAVFPEGHWQATCARIALAQCLSGLGKTAEAKRTLVETDLSPLWQSDRERRKALNHALALFEQWGWQERSEGVRTLLNDRS